MSQISPRRLLLLALTAFLLRAACAILTEFKPLFPPYYYTDANHFHEIAAHAVDPSINIVPLPVNGSLNERLQIRLTTAAYRVFGVRPIAVKLINALLGATAIGILAWGLGLLFAPRVALTAGAIAAAWPSNIFYTSQNLKESPTQFLAFTAVCTLLALGLEKNSATRRRALCAAVSAAALVATGMYRSYVLLASSAGIGAGFVLLALRERRTRFIAPVAVILFAVSVYSVFARGLLHALERRSGIISDPIRSQSPLIPVTFDSYHPAKVYHPTSPAGLTAFRRDRQYSDQVWARINSGREIGTQIFPEAIFATWADVFAYLPKGTFYVLFMPLPGLYPLDGKIGRICGAAENMILLSLASIAALGILRRAKSSAHMSLIFFFGIMAAGGGLLEFDLGSAGRHKLLYLPMLFPFAVEEILRFWERRKPR